MKKYLLSAIVLASIFTVKSYAQEIILGEEKEMEMNLQQEELRWGPGWGPGGGWGPGWGPGGGRGPGYPPPPPGYPGGGHGGPGYPPPPPPPPRPSYHYENIYCGNNGTCGFDSRYVTDVRFQSQVSNTPCVERRNFGIERNYVWVSDGCRAMFQVERYY